MQKENHHHAERKPSSCRKKTIIMQKENHHHAERKRSSCRKKTIIMQKENHHRAERDTLNIFIEHYCYKNIMCHLESGKLKITI